MAGQIRVVPGALRAASQRQFAAADATAEIAARLNSLVGELESSWQGGSSAQVVDSLNRMGDQCKQLTEFTQYCGSKLEGIANAFESVDEGSSIAFAALEPRVYQLLGCPVPMFPLMITDSLYIVPDEVRAIAAKAKEASDILERTGAEIKSLVSGLDGEWEGNSYNRFRNETEELITGYKELAGNLMEFADRITMMANRYEELDNSF